MMTRALSENAIQTKRRASAPWSSDVSTIIIGAGPYGLAAAAHLQNAGADVMVFGIPMEFWQNNMPEGMCLRSPRTGSDIASPIPHLDLQTYFRNRGERFPEPIPRKDFIAYGRWFAEKTEPRIDTRRVVAVVPAGAGFRIELADGVSLNASRVIVATGIKAFAQVPNVFGAIPSEYVSHSSARNDFSQFAGKSIVVIGAGQSALEYSALLNEAQAHVELIARAQRINWLHSHENKGLTPTAFLAGIRFLLVEKNRVGPFPQDHINGHPDILRMLPKRAQQALDKRAMRPAGSAWIRPRFEGIVSVTLGRTVTAVELENERVRLRLDDGTDRCVDHVLTATGYKIDVARYPFMTPELLNVLKVSDGYPALTRSLESSVPGFYFLGSPAARQAGPLLRFVGGTGYAARSILRDYK